ncbi:hypothetical protein CALVIDRAFT_249958 [Calocera viscosa TUFC12733]|uniref:Uncharacterized protein n=1 Tax=Calocera viscosa (strain TUFC12733) TaxID=1330018 RepID=A0A167JDT0_CALVF|nr:hypothetical protein CALVIDRAFT_249958 [Calocera viscosa TUFC12733]
MGALCSAASARVCAGSHDRAISPGCVHTQLSVCSNATDAVAAGMGWMVGETAEGRRQHPSLALPLFAKHGTSRSTRTPCIGPEHDAQTHSHLICPFLALCGNCVAAAALSS